MQWMIELDYIALLAKHVELELPLRSEQRQQMVEAVYLLAAENELVELEKETGIVLSNSPTVNVGYEVLSELPKEAHPSRMLSLDKTKDVDDIFNFIGNRDVDIMGKMDGLTCALT